MIFFEFCLLIVNVCTLLKGPGWGITYFPPSGPCCFQKRKHLEKKTRCKKVLAPIRLAGARSGKFFPFPSAKLGMVKWRITPHALHLP